MFTAISDVARYGAPIPALGTPPSMHILLYVIGVMATLVGIGAGVLLQQLNMIANGLLIGVLFGTLGKALHLLQRSRTTCGSASST
ncbi:hypothetical protein E6W36_05480 [Hankyongella ginsenosidimutans]|uniref:Uncharacterized protein n=1 Tax=Hankyongella ginsenosidimutans TaxID=1763828 RepID=A0A4D7C664_9SPHN|nr:hypothetical protein [Hankyongella ginsenosidimutans]QCI79205.1 hypothetical protein E6W36_05480 [Hankyongella ginsenosidimutans]